MNNQQYELTISHQPVTCLGEQLSKILLFIKPFLDHGIWYESDIDTTCDNLKVTKYMSYFPVKVGSLDTVISLANSVHQFLSGDFILMPMDYGDQLTFKWATEDKPLSDTGNAILKIITFDTSYFLIYSKNHEIIESLAKAFNGEVAIVNE